jgi:hypothetical protein
MKADDDGGLIWIVLLVAYLAAPDQTLASLDKVMGRGLLKVIRAKHALNWRFAVAVASGADGHQDSPKRISASLGRSAFASASEIASLSRQTKVRASGSVNPRTCWRW